MASEEEIYKKAERVAGSCETLDQIIVGVRYLKLAQGKIKNKKIKIPLTIIQIELSSRGISLADERIALIS